MVASMESALSRVRSPLAAALALACCAWASPATAQSVRLDQYRMAETPNDGFALSRPNTLGHVAFGARLDLDYALNPLVYQLVRSDPSSEVAAVVEHQLSGQLGLSFGLFDRLVAFAGIPVNFVIDGQQVPGQPRADGTSLGDLSVGLRGRLFGEVDDAFALSIQVAATAPTAQAARFQSRFAGESGFTVQPKVLLEVRIERLVRFTGNLGFLVREREDFGSLEVRSELTWGLGAAVAVVPDVLDVTVETWGATSLFDFGGAGVTPAEGILGLQVHPLEGLTLGAAAGTGFSRSYGTGDFRAILSLGYATPGSRPAGDRDSDGRADDVDQCPDEPEDVDGFADDDGCPDTDNDSDGIADDDDGCPNEAEDVDQLGDEDGCPEIDFDDDGAADEADRCPTVPGVALAPRPECTGCPTCDDAPPPQPEPEPESQPESAVEPEPRSYVAPDVGDRVLFDEGSWVLRHDQRATLERLRQTLASGSGRYVVEGHADQRGNEPENEALSRRRARRVMRWLQQHGIDPSRMVGSGCGEDYPRDDSSSRRVARAANRRVELRPVGSGPDIRPGCTPTELPGAFY
jgi:outer membrane protein OmpA-like peptidoglycan-associated protein